MILFGKLFDTFHQLGQKTLLDKDLFIIAPGNSTVGTIGSVASSLKTLVNSTLGFTNLIA